MPQIMTLLNATLITTYELKMIISLPLFTKPHLPPTCKHRQSENNASKAVQLVTLQEVKDIKHI